MDTLQVILLLLLSLSVTAVTSVRVEGRRSIDPHRHFNGLKPERGSSKRLKNLPRTHCHFHNSTFTLGEKWSPDFDPESEGKNINYCIICECEKREEKNRKGVIKLRSKVNCRNFAAECPEPKCNNPRVYDGHCCKSCSKDDEFERNIRRSNKTDVKAERKGNRKRNFIAVLRDTPTNRSSHSPQFTFANAPRIYMHLLKGNLGFIVESFGTDKPAYIRFHDLNDTILEEFVVKGNTSSVKEHRVHGIWQNMIEEHREMLRSNELKVSLSYVDDPDAESQVTGIVHRHKNNNEMNQKIQHMKRHSKSYLRAIKEPHLKMLNDDSESYENSIDLKTCSYHGRQYTEGEQWVDVNDPCETCTCQRGRVVCESEVCFALNCTQGVAPPMAGRCCPVCREQTQLSSSLASSSFASSSSSSPKTCDFMGRKFQSGEKWNPFLPPNGFNRCITCMCGPNGYPTCENVKCPPLSCPLYDRVVDGCCHRCSSRSSSPLYTSHLPQYDQANTDPIAEQQLRERDLLNGGGCRSGGQVYANGKEWHIPLGSFGTSRCTSCKCKNGKRTCFNRQCPVQSSCRNLVTRSFPSVIIVPHSHNDPGWLNTYDQYYYRYTYYILENMVKNLAKYPNMTFIWAEMSFFSRWWDGLTSEAAKQKVKNLLQGKRFEIVTGGWVMTDEASASYPDMLEQLIEGHQFLRSTLNYTPSNSWSVDPFGHSSTMPYLLQKSGLSNMYIQRTHFAWKRRLAETRSLEFFWRQFFQQQQQSKSSSRQSMMCHMSPLDLYSYKYACGPDYKTCLDFDFRKIFGESSESTAVELNSTNIAAKAAEIMEQYGKLGSLFRHNVALVLLGDDFRYDLDTEWRQQYDNYQRLMSYVNGAGAAQFKGARIQFGTLQDYFQAVNNRLPLDPKADAYPSLVGDFLPYADVYVSGEPNYWTGFYSTRPFFKQMSRQLQHWLRTAEIAYSLARHRLRSSNFTSLGGALSATLSNVLERFYGSHLAEARQNLSLFQHHDGITGTSRDYVMEDYARRMAHSIGRLMELTALSVQLMNAQHIKASANFSKPFLFAQQHKPSWSRLPDRRLLRVPAGESGLKLVLFNGNLQRRSETVRILVEDPFVKVIDVEDGRRVSVQVNPVYNGRQLSSNTFELEFAATLSPLSLKNYKVLTNEESIQAKVTIVTVVDNGANGSRSDGDGHAGKKRTKEQNNDTNNNNNNNNNGNRNSFNPVTSRTTSNEVFHFEALTPSSAPLYLENDLMRVELNKAGFIERLHHKASNTVEQVHMNFAAYHSKPTQSGAYLFKPVNRVPERLFTSATPRLTLVKGPLSSTVLVNYSDIAYSLTLHNSSSGPIGMALELKVLVDLGNAYNDREVVLQIGCKSILNQLGKRVGGSGNTTTKQYRSFYVDSNGFTILQRNFAPESGVEGNYYPMTTTAYIEDGRTRLSLLSSSSHGVTSPEDGTLELMLDRRILEDDKRGLSQGVTDNLPVELSFWLLLEKSTTTTATAASDQPTGQLSALADALLLQLNYPSTVLYSYKSDREVAREHGVNYFSNQNLIAPNLLCEYFLLNLRTMPLPTDFSHPSNSSLLLLHNRASVSSFSERQWQPMLPLSHRCDKASAVLLAKQGLHLFNGLRVASLEESTLTGLKALQPIESLAQLQVAPGEINAYTVHFN